MLTQTCPKQHCFIVEIEGYAQDECPKCRENGKPQSMLDEGLITQQEYAIA